MNTPGSVLYGWIAYTAAGILAFYIARRDIHARRQRDMEARLLKEHQESSHDDDDDGINTQNNATGAPLSFAEKMAQLDAIEKKKQVSQRKAPSLEKIDIEPKTSSSINHTTST